MKKIVYFIAGVLFAFGITAFAATTVFTDQNTFEDWYEDAVINLSNKGIITGYSDGSFQANNNVNRAELAVMLERFAKTIETGIDEDKVELCKTNLNSQLKSGEIEDWYEKGEIFAGFDEEKYSDDEILGILDEYGLKQHIDDEVDSDKIFYGIVYISVPEGDEFKWMCILSQDERVINTDLNFEHGYGANPEENKQ